MRIISGFNDYYDYLTNSNVDNKIVYNRHCQAYKATTKNGRHSYQLIGPHDPDVGGVLSVSDQVSDIDSVHFCGTRYCFVAKDGHFTYRFDEVHALLAAEMRRKRERPFAFENLRWTLDYCYSKTASSLNNDLTAPVVLESRLKNGNAYLTNISLKSIDFVQLFPPEQAFMAICNFLVPKEVEPDLNPDNMTRYEAKGFDKKVSFRKRS